MKHVAPKFFKQTKYRSFVSASSHCVVLCPVRFPKLTSTKYMDFSVTLSYRLGSSIYGAFNASDAFRTHAQSGGTRTLPAVGWIESRSSRGSGKRVILVRIRSAESTRNWPTVSYLLISGMLTASLLVLSVLPADTSGTIHSSVSSTTTDSKSARMAH